MELFEFKNKAHDLIEDLVESGMSRHRVYRKLQYFLNVSEHGAHLSSMTTISQVKRAIRALSYLKGRRIKDGKLNHHHTKELFLSGHKKRSTLV